MRRVLFLIIFLCSMIPVSAQTLPFAEGEVDVSAPYVGQPIIYTLRIFTTESIENSTIIEPSFFGFGRSRVTFEPGSYTESRDGIGYQVIEQSYVIYALRAGELTIDPFRVDIPETPFSEARIIVTDAITITVQDFPDPAPESFVNAVGQFDIIAQANPTTLSSGDALTLSVTISGTGNFEQMLAPEINLPEDWRLFDGQTSFQQDSLRFGTKTFTWSVLVQGDGSTTFPAIEFSYFNPQTQQYESRNTAPINLNITPTTAQPQATVERTQVVSTSVPVPALMTIGNSSTIPPNPPIWLWSIWIFPPLVTFAIWLFARPKRERRQRPVARKPRKQSGNKALKALRADLLEAQSLEAKDAYQEIATAIYAYLGTKTGETVTANNAKEAMKGFPANYRDVLLSSLEEANAGQYAPVTQDDVRVLSQRMLKVCVAIEKASR